MFRRRNIVRRRRMFVRCNGDRVVIESRLRRQMIIGRNRDASFERPSRRNVSGRQGESSKWWVIIMVIRRDDKWSK